MTPSGDLSRSVWGAGVVDLVLIGVFAVAGRSSHDRAVLALGYFTTLWTFAVGAAVGWLLTRAWRRPLAPVPTGVGVWLSTVTVGVALRAVSGQGTAIPFVIVATATLALCLVGWRLVATCAVRVRAAR
ncbi:DUF3054 domain-containing protein [Phytoactinopolyspora halotolerans]|uniref:DUF3054 domain-containing protein n=1 Tax=Phytoactinopolyspora halotolerans TaxID=1981512 RepID=A0A6L9S936_9ACTN|nr:DUF3054 domain-containing protein [Phytoactinopolyspora halotolerans]NEE01925.1 DUF3054 domain-containing protein [Phytoactinopolyspora halotolerans]